MQAEREREAKRYRSEGEEEAAKLRAETDKERTIILADAEQKAQHLRGEGDAAAAEIYAQAYSKNPEFYSFMRSLQADATIPRQAQHAAALGGFCLVPLLGQPAAAP